MGDETAITVGGEYKESDDFVPNPSDMQGQFNTSGLGASGRIEEVSSVFEVDKVQTAQQIKDALDDDNDVVGSDKVLLPENTTDNDTAKEQILAAAEKRVKEGVEINGPTPAEREAAEEGQEVRAESNASTGSSSGDDTKKSTSKKSDSKS